MPASPTEPEMMTPGEVAAMFRVSAKTVRRWADDGLVRSTRTLGGHRRYYSADIRTLIANSQEGTTR